MNQGIKFGLFYGLVSVILSLVLYLIDKELMTGSIPTTIAAFVIATVFMVLAAKATKADNGGILPYGEAVITTFLVLSIGFFISGLFIYVMFNFIDPSLVDLTRERAIEMTEKLIAMMGQDNEDAIDKMREALEEQDFSMGLGQVLMSWLGNSVVGLIYALIISAFVKKEATLS